METHEILANSLIPIFPSLFVSLSFFLLSSTFLTPHFSAPFTGMAGKQRNRRLAEVEMKQWTEGAFFMSPHGSKGWGRAMCVNTHTYTHTCTKPCVQSREELAGKSKVPTKCRMPVKREKRGVILKKPIVHLPHPWCQALLRACRFHMNLPNLWLFNSTSDLSEKCNYTRGKG